MKNVSRIKFLHCFRRPVIEDMMLEPRRRRNQLMHLLIDEDDNERASVKPPYARSRKHSFSRMLKSALFYTALKLIDDQANQFCSTSLSSGSSLALEYVDCVFAMSSPCLVVWGVTYLLFISLMGTVLCGRAYAIVFALMWLLVVTRRLCWSVTDNDDDHVETDEKKRRKTVAQFMEVLGRMRERNRPKK
ncbi:hypothetical protein ACJRO7_001750 [Eucalyptus globulus]|uniref:Uncharacterized protein n=1 Tax=Eucalyptus globulus TaxID=34317 RepID=A0ABD3LRZ9_EUCGL